MTKFAGARTRLFVGGAVLALATAALAPAAMAQTPDAARATISEVIVTATKSSTNLQKTPISISVVGGADMESRHVESLVNLMDGAVPSLRVATFEARQSALTIGIRGIVPFDANQTARDQGVGVYIDGVYLGRQQGLNAALFDVERIEVLRGPQGTLFGRNTEGGALSIVTKQPTGQMGGRVIVGAEVHPSVTKSLGILGLGRSRVVKVPVDDQGRIRADAFFENLEPLPDAFELYEAVADKRPIILTGMPHGHWAGPQKRRWGAKYFPGVRMITTMAALKREHCHPGDVLVDDRQHYRHLWEAEGGIFVLHKDARSSIAELKRLEFI